MSGDTEFPMEKLQASLRPTLVDTLDSVGLEVTKCLWSPDDD